jgi:hypothetical protein
VLIGQEEDLDLFTGFQRLRAASQRPLEDAVAIA